MSRHPSLVLFIQCPVKCYGVPRKAACMQQLSILCSILLQRWGEAVIWPLHWPPPVVRRRPWLPWVHTPPSTKTSIVLAGKASYWLVQKYLPRIVASLLCSKPCRGMSLREDDVRVHGVLLKRVFLQNFPAKISTASSSRATSSQQPSLTSCLLLRSMPRISPFPCLSFLPVCVSWLVHPPLAWDGLPQHEHRSRWAGAGARGFGRLAIHRCALSVDASGRDCCGWFGSFWW